MPYNDDEVKERLNEHPGWKQSDDGPLQSEFTFDDFSHALLFVNAVGHLAESANHHPDILIHGYNKVRLRVMSHDVGGITARDFKLIEKIGALTK